MTKDKVKDFFAKFPVKKYKKGEILLASEENPRHTFFLVNGFIREYAVSAEGEDLTIHVYTPNSFFPLFWALNKIPNTHYFEALDESTVYLAPHEATRQFLKKNPKITLKLTQRLLTGLHKLAKRLENIIFGNAQARVASMLVYLCDHFGNRNKGSITIAHKFTHQEIATLTGLTRERVSLELEKLTRLGVITFKNQKITIIKIDSLKKLL